MVTTGRSWLAALVVLLVLALVVGARTPVRPDAAPGAALGPRSGEQVGAYTARAAASLGGVGATEDRWALLSPTTELDPAGAAVVASGLRTSRVLLQVPVPRVQTPLVALEVADQGDLATELTALARLAGGRQLGLAQVSTGRAAAVARLTGSRLEAGCACVVGLLVRGTGTALRAAATRADVRAVEAAPAGTGYGGLSVVPLLPSQTTTVGPGPDDGAVPDPASTTPGPGGAR